MHRPTVIRALYTELRHSVPASVSAAEVLEAAGSLLALFEDGDEGGGCDLRTGGRPFDEWAVDVAFADGGWRVLCREREIELARRLPEGAPWTSDDAFDIADFGRNEWR